MMQDVECTPPEAKLDRRVHHPGNGKQWHDAREQYDEHQSRPKYRRALNIDAKTDTKVAK